MLKKHNYITLLLAAAICIFSSCEKSIEIEAPINELSSALVFTSDNTAKSALSGLYGTLSQSSTQSQYLTIFTSLASDELEYLSTSTFYDDVRTNTMIATSGNSSTVFSEYYSAIYKANSIIEGLQKYNGTTAAVRKQIAAETKFLRAYCYFNLVNLYGAVPLVLETDVNKTAFLPRTDSTIVYQQIIKDLIDAKDSLPADYSASASNRYNANKYAAQALLARTYLTTRNYVAADSNATAVINATALYSLIPSATMGTGVFVKNSSESILQFLPYLTYTNSYTAEGSNFVSTAASFSLRSTYVNSFETADLRKSKWINTVTFNGVVNYQPFKYKYRTNALAVAAGVNEYPMILRLAEQYLIRAEARAYQNNLSGALSDMNVIRLRAGLTASTTSVQGTLLQEIQNERQHELFCELGLRWYDLRRTGKATAVIGAVKPTWTATAVLFPIPQTAIDANYNLTQNPGY